MQQSRITKLILVPFALLFAIIILGATATGMVKTSPTEELSTNTNGNTRYILRCGTTYGNDLMSHINPFSGKDHYTVEVQKAKTDKHGIKVWKYDKTVDYGTHKPNIAN